MPSRLSARTRVSTDAFVENLTEFSVQANNREAHALGKEMVEQFEDIVISRGLVDTGDLASGSVEYKITFSNRVAQAVDLVATGDVDPKKIAAIEYGHSGYWIEPVRKKALKWDTKDGGKVFAKRVYMPPRAGEFVMREAMNRAIAIRSG